MSILTCTIKHALTFLFTKCSTNVCRITKSVFTGSGRYRGDGNDRKYTKSTNWLFFKILFCIIYAKRVFDLRLCLHNYFLPTNALVAVNTSCRFFPGVNVFCYIQSNIKLVTWKQNMY